MPSPRARRKAPLSVRVAVVELALALVDVDAGPVGLDAQAERLAARVAHGARDAVAVVALVAGARVPMLLAHKAHGSQPEYAPSSLVYSSMSSSHSMPIQPGMQTHSCRFGPRSSQVPRIGSQSPSSVQVRPWV